jgi:hypothetical protein
MGPASGEARVGLPVSSRRRALPHTGAAPRLLEVATLRRGGSNGAPSGGPTVSPAPGWPWPASSPPVLGPWRRPPGERVCLGPAGVERVCTATLGPSTGCRGGLGELRQPVSQVAPDVCGISVGPGAFDQHASGLRVTGCGACTRPVWRIPGIRRGDPAPIVPHVARFPDVRQVAACGHVGQGHDARHPPRAIQSRDHWRPSPVVELSLPCLLQALQAFGGRMDRADVLLEDERWRWGGTDHCGAPPLTGQAPGSLARLPDLLPAPDGVESARGGLQVPHDIVAGTGEIAYRCICHSGTRGRGEIT